MTSTLITHPRTLESAQWRDAADRVARSLRAHGLADARRVSALTADVIGIARATQAPGATPMTSAMATLGECQAAWFGRFLPQDSADHDDRLARGRLALALTPPTTRWPQVFLRENAGPPSLASSLRRARLVSGPEINLRHMVPPPESPAGQSPRHVPWRWALARTIAALVMLASLVKAAIAVGR